MFVLFVKPAVGTEATYVARTQKRLREELGLFTNPMAWRMFDTSRRGGWCDGSPDAWRTFSSEVHFELARVLL